MARKRARSRYQTGSIFLRGDKWYGRWREDTMIAGERVCCKRVIGTKTQYPTKRLAQRALADILTPINSLTYQARPIITFAAFAAKWQSSVLTQHKPSTGASVRSNISLHLEPQFGALSLADLTNQRVQHFVSEWQLSPKSLRNCVAAMRMMWHQAKSWGYVTHDPFEGLVLPDLQPYEARHFSVDELRLILAAADDPFLTFYWLATETGMRAGELCGQRISDFNAASQVVRVRQSVWHGKIQQPKSRAALRTCAISPQLTARLQQHIAARRTDDTAALLFVTRNGTPWDANLVVKRHLHPLLDSLGIARCGLHAFRHANASLMNQLDTDFKTRQYRMGHSDARLTLDTYTHAVSVDNASVAMKIGALLASNCVETQTAQNRCATPSR